jgi:MarR family transcriptional regulator, organic hydroperoxide resistance regulator
VPASPEKSRRISLDQATDPSLQTWLALWRVYQKMQRELDRVLDDAGLTVAQFDVLANLGMAEGITQQELAERLLVTKGNVCGVLDRMESAGLVERRPDPRDRRANRLHMTRQGRAALHNAFPAHLGVIQRCFEVLSVADRRTLHQLVTRLGEAECFG